MKTFAVAVGLFCVLSMPGGFGEEPTSPENPAVAQKEAKPNGSEMKPSSLKRLVLKFPNDSVESLLSIYDRLIEKEVRRDPSLAEGPKIALVTPSEVSVDGAIALIEAALLVNGYVIEETIEGNVTVRFDATRRGNWILGSVVELPPHMPKSRPTEEDSRRFKDLTAAQRSELLEFITRSMKENPDMSREERGNLIRDKMERLVGETETSDSQEKQEKDSKDENEAPLGGPD